MFKEMWYWLAKPVLGLYGRILKLNVYRHERLPKGAKIIAVNHPSTSDPFLILKIAGQPARILVINHAFQVPLFGAYLRLAGHIPVIPGQGRKAFDAAEAHLRKGGTLIIFPEGHLSPPQGGFLKPRSGVARLALSTGAPVIPVGISLSPRGLWHVQSAMGDDWVESRWALRGPYGVTFGKPLHFEGDVEDRDMVKQVSRYVMQHIKELAHESQERLNAPHLWPSILEPLRPR